MKNKKVLFNYDEDVYKVGITVGTYENNGRLYVGLYTITNDTYETVADLTTNIPDMPLLEHEGFLDVNHCDYESIEKFIHDNQLARIGHHAMGSYPYAFFDLEKLREFDPEGVKEYEKPLESKIKKRKGRTARER